MTPSTIIKSAYWLTQLQKEIIEKTFSYHPLVQQLNRDERLKLLGIICCIPYAELNIRKMGKFYLNNLESLLSKLKLKDKFCNTLGTWCFNTCHYHRFTSSKKEFKKIIQDDVTGLPLIIEFIIYELGLNKPVEHLFAEYNANIGATVIAALQNALNQLMSLKGLNTLIQVDGFMGEKTHQALKICEKSLNISFYLKEASDHEISRVLITLKKLHKIDIEPLIPPLITKFDLFFALRILKKSLFSPRELSKLKRLFYNHINIPAYVNSGMEAYHFLIFDN